MHYGFKSTPTWTLKGRPQTSDYKTPGPADYNVQKLLHNSGNISAVTQSRNLYKNFQMFPGPGTYNSKSYTLDGPKRSMSARYFQTNKVSPGPHEYDNDNIKVKNKAPRFTMSSRSKSYHQLTTDQNMYTPGPTKYDHRGSFEKKNGGVVIGSSQRKDLTETQKTPGPNYYQSEKSGGYVSTNNPQFSMGHQFRKTTDFMKAQTTPGPGNYQKKTLFQLNKQKKSGFSCRQKTADLIAYQISKFPGPGQYDSPLKNKHSAPRIANPSSKRKTFIDDMQDFKKQYPSPSKYDSTTKISKYRSVSTYNFGKSQRQPLDQNQKTPAPNIYSNTKIDLLKTAPRFTLSKKLLKHELQGVNPEAPGPGHYNPSIKLIKQNPSIYEIGSQSRPSFEKHKYSPGPGYYNLRGKQSEGPKFAFSKQSRIAFTDKNSEAKDGIHYDIPQKVVDPPKYMNVKSKVSFNNDTAYSTINTARKSPQKRND